MYNLRKNKTNTKITKKPKTKISKGKYNNLQASFDLNMEEAGVNTTTTKTPANKLVREHLQSVSHTVNKSYTDSPFKLLTVMDKRFDKLSERIEKVVEDKLSQYKIELLNDLDMRFNLIKNELNAVIERVSLLETAAVEIKSMQEEIATLKTKIKHQENNTVACELRLNEIPFHENENLMDIFCSICETIKTTVPAIKSIYRLQNLNNKKQTFSRDAVIMVKMCSPYDKNFFLKSLASFKKQNKDFSFRLRHIGFNSDNKFYINENLTKTNFQIFRAAVRLKKKNRIYSVFTMRGFVYIKKTAEDNAMEIDDIELLYNLFPDSEMGDAFEGRRNRHIV